MLDTNILLSSCYGLYYDCIMAGYSDEDEDEDEEELRRSV